MAGKLQKKHFKSLAVIASVTALVVISSTMAFFSSNDNTTNKFIGTRFDISLTETKWDAEQAKEVIPGQELDKNPHITNKEQTECYVFLRVTVPCDTQMVDNDDGTPMDSALTNVPMYKFMISAGTNPETYLSDTEFSPKQKVHSHWKLIDDSGSNYTYFNSEEQQFVYVYAYAEGDTLTPLRKNEITEPLFDKLRLWNFNEQFDPSKSHNVRVEALGIQTDIPGISAGNISSVWEIVSGEAGNA